MDNMSVLVAGLIERLGETDSLHKYCLVNANGSMQETIDEKIINDHRLGLIVIISIMESSGLHQRCIRAFGYWSSCSPWWRNVSSTNPD